MKESGCTLYAKATVDIYFPDGHVCCALCPLLEVYARKQCRRTGEYILDDRVCGIWCPLIVKEADECEKEHTSTSQDNDSEVL